MQIITVELLDDRALALLKQLEQLHILRFVTNEKLSNQPKRQWAGSISMETAANMLLDIDKSRGTVG
jgi:hypothetical protein